MVFHKWNSKISSVFSGSGLLSSVCGCMIPECFNIKDLFYDVHRNISALGQGFDSVPRPGRRVPQRTFSGSQRRCRPSDRCDRAEYHLVSRGRERTAPRRAGLSRRRVWHSRLESRGTRHLHNAESERIFRVSAEIPLSRPSHRRPCGCRPCHAHDPGERGTVRNS